MGTDWIKFSLMINNLSPISGSLAKLGPRAEHRVASANTSVSMRSLIDLFQFRLILTKSMSSNLTQGETTHTLESYVNEQILAKALAQEVSKHILSKLFFNIIKNVDLYRIELTTELKLVWRLVLRK
jgi:hypothetical protein